MTAPKYKVCRSCNQRKSIKQDFGTYKAKRRRGRKVKARCKSCVATQKAHSRNGGFTEGHCDQYCPICGAGPFVIATRHVTELHGLTLAQVHERYGKLSSRNWKEGTVERYNRNGIERMAGTSVKQHALSKQRHDRWFETAKREQPLGGDWVERCGKHWRVSSGAARNRIRLLREAGYPLSSKIQPMAKCRKGHAFTPDNVYLDPRGTKHCRACRTDSFRRWYERNYVRKSAA